MRFKSNLRLSVFLIGPWFRAPTKLLMSEFKKFWRHFSRAWCSLQSLILILIDLVVSKVELELADINWSGFYGRGGGGRRNKFAYFPSSFIYELEHVCLSTDHFPVDVVSSEAASRSKKSKHPWVVRLAIR